MKFTHNNLLVLGQGTLVALILLTLINPNIGGGKFDFGNYLDDAGIIAVAEAGGAGGGGGGGGSGGTSGGKGGGGGGGTSGGKGGGSGTSGGKGGGAGATVNDPTWGSISVVAGPPPGYSYYGTRTIGGVTYDTYYDSSVGRAGGPTAGSPRPGGGGGGGGGGLPPTVATRPPTVTLRVAVNGGALQAGTVNVAVADTLELYWNVVSFGTGLNCTPLAAFVPIYPGVVNGMIAIATPAPSTSQTYRLSCTDSNGSDTGTVIVGVPAPTAVDLRVRLVGNPAWSNTTPFIIAGLQQVELRWQDSAGTATSCSTTGPGFINSGTSGIDSAIIEPALGTGSTYQARCTGPGGNSLDTIDIHNPAPNPVVAIAEDLVDIGDTVDLTWNTMGNNPAACRLSGPALNRTLTATEPTGTISAIVINGESNFSIICDPNGINPGGTGADRVNVTAQQTEN